MPEGKDLGLLFGVSKQLYFGGRYNHYMKKALVISKTTATLEDSRLSTWMSITHIGGVIDNSSHKKIVKN